LPPKILVIGDSAAFIYNSKKKKKVITKDNLSSIEKGTYRPRNDRSVPLSNLEPTTLFWRRSFFLFFHRGGSSLTLPRRIY